VRVSVRDRARVRATVARVRVRAGDRVRARVRATVVRVRVRVRFGAVVRLTTAVTAAWPSMCSWWPGWG